ncbi:MAG: methylmalonyl-CoA mutase family protein [Leptospirales bacterium]|nr:methylmalonyl-CoA mutase family protein [Leptospirales bacterium]
MKIAPATEAVAAYQPRNKIRFVTAAALFDGHDASINIMRRLLQNSGAEVIHLGHNRSVHEVVQAAIQEDVQGVAISSYQGGHMEYFRYLRQLLDERGAHRLRIFGGGGGVIVASEIKALAEQDVARIFSPEDGRRLGLQGMINEMLEVCDWSPAAELNGHLDALSDWRRLAQAISFVEAGQIEGARLPDLAARLKGKTRPPLLGISGPGGAGKSSLCDELCLRLLEFNPALRLAVLAIDPTRRKTGGALLGDRIRMNACAAFGERLFFRSMATRGDHGASLSAAAQSALELLQAADFDLIILESAGAGQSDAAIAELVDLSLYVMTPEFGAPSQLEKIAMLDYADLVALNKAEKRGADDAIRQVQKQMLRNRSEYRLRAEEMPVYATVASRFNDPGVHQLYNAIVEQIEQRSTAAATFSRINVAETQQSLDLEILPASRQRYLSEVSACLRDYWRMAGENVNRAADLEALRRSLQLVQDLETPGDEIAVASTSMRTALRKLESEIDQELLGWLGRWPELHKDYSGAELVYRVRDRTLRQKLRFESLAGISAPTVALPRYQSLAELARYYYAENLPGSFPYTASVFPFRKQDEAPTRMFAGEGGPERSNARFHYLTKGRADQNENSPARLSTAFDSVTLYGEDPARRPDIYGKVGNSGVSVPTLDDCKRLYSGFDLGAPGTSVSMTINGPAPVLLAFFFNAAIDQAVERDLAASGELQQARQRIAEFYDRRGLPAPVYQQALPAGHNGLGLATLGLPGDRLVDAERYQRIKSDVLKKIRGTVQADILKEDQAQNTCIFSTPFALKMMGDIQEYFVAEGIRNFYSVSISGYHMAEAGANPITQLAFTLANGFTYVEYYLRRGLDINAFAPNFSFFFSNGLDAEYAVIGRVARRLWAVAMQRLYRGDERSQKLKYHIQTSGRSLHAREIDFNDIRTTLQALYAIYDNCNSLHTNAFDEAITTPTEQSVRRALAIQLIINQELGLNRNHNPLQGSYIIEELTDLVEEAVLAEFDRLSERGGVLGAMELMYQRSRIQEESLEYERRKHSGELPIAGVNFFLNASEPGQPETELIRSSDREKQEQIRRVEQLHHVFDRDAAAALERLKRCALRGENLFAELMECVKCTSLGQISQALYQAGGSYRRNM